jgi:hypothetical protein
MGVQINVSAGPCTGLRERDASSYRSAEAIFGFMDGTCLSKTQRSHDRSSSVEDQAVDIVDEVGEADLGLCTCDADGADEQPHLVLLASEHVLNAGVDGGVGRVGPRGAGRRRLRP